MNCWLSLATHYFVRFAELLISVGEIIIRFAELFISFGELFASLCDLLIRYGEFQIEVFIPQRFLT